MCFLFLQPTTTVTPNGTQVIVSTIAPADLAARLKEGTMSGAQVVQVPAAALSSVDWAAKLKVGIWTDPFYVQNTNSCGLQKQQ